MKYYILEEYKYDEKKDVCYWVRDSKMIFTKKEMERKIKEEAEIYNMLNNMFENFSTDEVLQPNIDKYLEYLKDSKYSIEVFKENLRYAEKVVKNEKENRGNKQSIRGILLMLTFISKNPSVLQEDPRFWLLGFTRYTLLSKDKYLKNS